MSSPRMLHVACIQLTSSDDIGRNIDRIIPRIREAREKGAELICLPENAFLMQDPKAPRQTPIAQEDHEALKAVQLLAAQLQCWILLGSLHVPAASGEKLFNRSLMIDAKGQIVAQYDKIHLFDVTLPGGESYCESDRICGGETAVMVHTPWAKIGMSVCYDVRFAELYRKLALEGAEIFTIPAAFTRTTGEAHWHVLLRARAIENGAFVIAPAQTGTHAGGRQTFGHSMIIDPWGRVLAEGGEEEGIIYATLHLDEVAAARRQIPSLQHGRAFNIRPS